jgi:hypothetical protein
MNNTTFHHYLQFSEFTFPGGYLANLRDSLPNDIPELGKLICVQTIHRMVLKSGNTGSNSDLRYGDMSQVPWYRQCEDDIFPTASSMIAELFRRDPRGFVHDRRAQDKLILTCRADAVLTAAVLKSKGIPTRVRSGFAPYFEVNGLPRGTSNDHWLNEYWSEKEKRWIIIDVDGCLEPYLKFDPFDVPREVFDFSADAWLGVRQGKLDGEHFYNAGGHSGSQVIAWELFYDFHCLMNSESIYIHTPAITHFANFPKLTEKELSEIDDLARLMQKPDENFVDLQRLWETKKEYRLLRGGVL